MPFSALQKYITKSCYGQKKVLVKTRFEKFYCGLNKVSGKSERTKIISRSIDRLINKGIMTGWGEKTQHKWFISEIRLTPSGRKAAKKLQGEQTKLQFKK